MPLSIINLLSLCFKNYISRIISTLYYQIQWSSMPCHSLAKSQYLVFYELWLGLCWDFVVEPFHLKVVKTKTKVIILANHNRCTQSNEPIRARSKYMSPAPSAGKRASKSWFWFHFWLVINWGRGRIICSQSQSVAIQNQHKSTQLKAALMLIFFLFSFSERVRHIQESLEQFIEALNSEK